MDELEFKEYVSKDDSRAGKLWDKIYSMRTAFDNWRKEGECAAQIRDQREAAGAERLPEGREELSPGGIAAATI